MTSAEGSIRDVAVLVGSLRKESFSRKIATVLMKFAPAPLKLDLVAIGQLPFYNQDEDEGEPPQAWTVFRRRIEAATAVLFVTPEYNRSVPAVLKNALDVGSRPYGQSVWNAKPGAVVSVSPGAIGGSGPTTICASRWSSSIYRHCSNLRPILAE
jgi:chromate reductase, NAD(P)H dehydrogenase (quinone)